MLQMCSDDDILSCFQTSQAGPLQQHWHPRQPSGALIQIGLGGALIGYRAGAIANTMTDSLVSVFGELEGKQYAKNCHAADWKAPSSTLSMASSSTSGWNCALACGYGALSEPIVLHNLQHPESII